MMDSKLMTFITVANLKSYTRAAEALNLTQPAVTQHIKQLETYYEATLIKKKGRQISLTEEGKLLLKSAQEFRAQSVLLEKLLKNKSSVIKRYNIGATLTIGEFVLPGLLGDYKSTHHHSDIIMHVHNLQEVLERTRLGEYDLGIVEGPFDKSKFIHKKLKDDELVFVTSPKSDFANKGEIDIDSIINSGRLILREKGSGTRVIFENKLQELSYNPAEIKLYMELGSLGAIKSLVAANLGYSIISIEAVKSEVADGSLVIVPIKGVRILREFNLVFLSKGQIDFIDDFYKFIKTKLDLKHQI